MNKEKDTKRPELNSTSAEKELDKLAEQFNAYDENVKELSLKRMDLTKKPETEQQTKLSSQELRDQKIIWLKPTKSIGSAEKFNERFRPAYDYCKEFVKFIAENVECEGDVIEIWTKPYAGMPAEEWRIPVNVPVWGPRYVAEQIRRKYYHRLKSEETKITGKDGYGEYTGQLVVDTKISRIDAVPYVERNSIFMGGRSSTFPSPT